MCVTINYKLTMAFKYKSIAQLLKANIDRPSKFDGINIPAIKTTLTETASDNNDTTFIRHDVMITLSCYH